LLGVAGGQQIALEVVWQVRGQWRWLLLGLEGEGGRGVAGGGIAWQRCGGCRRTRIGRGQRGQGEGGKLAAQKKAERKRAGAETSIIQWQKKKN
jgi:hypothetical protein